MPSWSQKIVAEASPACHFWIYQDTTLFPVPVKINCKTPTDFNGDRFQEKVQRVLASVTAGVEQQEC